MSGLYLHIYNFVTYNREGYNRGLIVILSLFVSALGAIH